MKIAQVIYANTWGDVTPEAFERGIGGREGALIRLATEWSKMGHEVTNFVPVDKSTRHSSFVKQENLKPFNLPGSNQGYRSGFHEYVPVNLAKHMLANFPYDAVVAWECPEVFASEAVLEKQKIRLVHMQVAHLEEMDLAAEFATGMVFLSEWAKDFMVHSGLQMGNDKLHVRPNGVNISDYPLDKAMKRHRNVSFVYSSSPDRGLWHLLKMWPKIRKEYKKANLYVAYGVSKYTDQIKWAHSRVGEMSLEIEQLMKQPGVVDVGKIGQKQLAELQLKATAWLYPADTIQATETGCITAIENAAAGNPIVTTDADCMADEFGPVGIIINLPFDPDKYLEAVSHVLTNQMGYNEMRHSGRMLAESRDWSLIAPTWIDLFKENYG